MNPPSARQLSDSAYFQTSCNPCPWPAQPPPDSSQQVRNEHDATYDEAILIEVVEAFVIVGVRPADDGGWRVADG